MAILIDENTRVLVQGITGSVGAFQSKIMKAYGTNIVAGVTPGKGGLDLEGIPIYDLVEEAIQQHDINAAISFVPARFAKDAAIEVLACAIPFLVLTTEGLPDNDVLELLRFAELQNAIVLGPETPGLISPDRSKLGVHPHTMFMKGPVGVVSKSGSLSYEVGRMLTLAGMGQSTVVGIGGGPIWGLSQQAVLQLFENDPGTGVVLLLGEVGGRLEHDAASFITHRMSKPVVALIVGRTAPMGAQMGHAGAILEGDDGTAESKINALKAAGAYVAKSAREIPEIIGRMGV